MKKRQKIKEILRIFKVTDKVVFLGDRQNLLELNILDNAIHHILTTDSVNIIEIKEFQVFVSDDFGKHFCWLPSCLLNHARN
jgi:hypothetical protein